MWSEILNLVENLVKKRILFRNLVANSNYWSQIWWKIQIFNGKIWLKIPFWLEIWNLKTGTVVGKTTARWRWYFDGLVTVRSTWRGTRAAAAGTDSSTCRRTTATAARVAFVSTAVASAPRPTSASKRLMKSILNVNEWNAVAMSRMLTAEFAYLIKYLNSLGWINLNLNDFEGEWF